MVHVTAPDESRAQRSDGLPEPASPFESAVVDLLVDLFAAYPTWGTQVGYHVVDGRWSDLTSDGRASRIAMLRRHHETLAAFSDDALDAEERIDRGIVLGEIERALFGEEALIEHAWDPLSIVSLIGGGLFGILAREYAPWSQRGASLRARLEGIPALVRDAIGGLTGLPDRPVVAAPSRDGAPAGRGRRRPHRGRPRRGPGPIGGRRGRRARRADGRGRRDGDRGDRVVP